MYNIIKCKKVWLLFACLTILFTFVSCDRRISYHELDEFNSGYGIDEDNISTEENLHFDTYNDAFTFRNLDSMYSMYNSSVYYVAWNPFILSYSSGETISSVCKDPICNHMTAKCITYDIFRSKMLIINDVLYYRGMQTTNTNGIVNYTLNSLDLNTMKKRVVYETNNQMQNYFNTGKYLYIIDNIGDSQNELIRIDLHENEAVKLAQFDSSSIAHVAACNGNIYYLKYGELCVADYNFMNEKVLVEGLMVRDYGFNNGNVYFSTYGGSTYSDLYEYNISTGTLTLIINNVYSYFVDSENLYFSLYNPIDGYKITDGDAEYTISIPSGNVIYVVGLDEVYTSGIMNAKKFISPPDGYYYYDMFFVYDNYLYAMLRSRYKNENDEYTHADFFMRTHIREIKWEELTSYLPF